MSTPAVTGGAPETLAEGRFKLLEVIGEGGMATVYRAFDQRLQRPRAIKVLAPALASRPSLRRRFLAEAQTMANLEESRVVRIFDSGEDGDRVYIVMELVDGGSLLDRVRDFGPLPPRMAAEATIQICESLQAAHDAGVIHRDIKPHNILLTRTGEIRVTDFGIAQVQTEDGDGMTRTGAVMGTWGFMAPEQKTNAKQVDVRADIYSVGATLWSLLRAETPPELFMADAEPGMLADVPEELAEVIRRATRYRREERYLSARDMADSLRALLSMLAEDPELTVPLVGHALERPGRPLDTMQQFASDPGTGVESPGSFTMVPTLGEKPEPPEQPVAEPSVVTHSPSPPALPSPEPTHGSGPFLLVGGAVVAFVFVLAVGVGGYVLWPRPDAIEAPVVAPPVTPPVASPVTPAPTPVTTGASVPVTTPPELAPDVVQAPTTPTRKSTAVATPSTQSVATPAAADPPVAAPVVAAEDTVAAAPAKALRHTPPGAARVGEAIPFAATLPESGWTVKLYYRPASGGAFDNKAMVASGSTYTTSLKATDAMAGGVAYFISATKGTTTLKEGSATSPRRVAITP